MLVGFDVCLGEQDSSVSFAMYCTIGRFYAKFYTLLLLFIIYYFCVFGRVTWYLLVVLKLSLHKISKAVGLRKLSFMTVSFHWL
jgi:hypothetical protein